MDLTWVDASAVIKARDGSSVADWDETSGARADHFLADPERIQAFVEAVEAAGLVVGAIGDFTVAFAGRADALSAFVGAAVDTSTPGAPTWPTGQSDLTPSGGHDVAAQVSVVRLLPVAQEYAREYEVTEVSPAEVLPTDLLIGEVGATLGPGFPQRLTDGDPVPLDRLEAATRLAVGEWRDSFTKLRTGLGTGRALTMRPTRVTMLEGAGGHGVEKLLTDYGLVGQGSTFTVRRLDDDLRAVYSSPGSWDVYLPSKAELLVEMLDPKVGDAVAASGAATASLTTYLARGGRTDDNQADLVAEMSLLADELRGIAGLVAHLRSGGGSIRKDGAADPNGSLDSVDDAAIAASATRLEAFMARGGVTPAEARGVRDDIALKPLAALRSLLGRLVPPILADRSLAIIKLEYHSQMVAVGLHSVASGTRLDTGLACHLQKDSILWSQDRAGADRSARGARGNVVLSASFGRAIPIGAGDWATMIARRRQESAARLSDNRTLYVLAASNHGTQDGRPSMNLAWAGCANVITVGGCEPVRNPATHHLEWHASDATHGYAFTYGGQTQYLPDVTTTTKGQGGGSVLYPTHTRSSRSVLGGALRPGPWLTGGGSSLSAPILAAVAGIVWKHYTEFSASELKDILLLTARPLAGGTFYRPANLLPLEASKVVADSHKVSTGAATDHPAGRAQLGAALTEASRRLGQRWRETSHDLLTGASSSTSAAGHRKGLS